MSLFADPVAGDPVRAAIRSASQRTGSDFSYLLATAQRESSLNPDAKAPTSSASGLFQFIEQTWLRMVRDTGAEHGLGEFAAEIETASNGRAYVRDAETRAEVLALRFNPDAASLMAGELTEHNRDGLERALGREPEPGELYIAHFLGLDGARRFISMAESHPDAIAASHFPAAAKANRPIFYSGGTPRSMAGVYDNLIAKHEAVETQVAGAEPDRASPFFGFLRNLFGRAEAEPTASPTQTPASVQAFNATSDLDRHDARQPVLVDAVPQTSVRDLFQGPQGQRGLGPMGARSIALFDGLYADPSGQPIALTGFAQISRPDPAPRSASEHAVTSLTGQSVVSGTAEAVTAAPAAAQHSPDRFWSAEVLGQRRER